ncbi:HD domain-containing protein [Leptotrichia sp. OH3620_COT-345]|nr:HD domain-containing protein [Leptotrichia sp. OH3620_COT-345]
MNINKIKENVKKYLDEKRYKHVERVAEAAKNLAGIYRISINETEAAAYLHDVAKFFELSVMIDLVKGKYPEIEDELSKSTAILHGFAGAEFIKNNYELFEIDNEEILNAVKYHTIGSGKMGVLSKIIYLADAIEDGRTWQGVEKARELAKYNLDEAIIFEINTKIEYLLSKRSIIHPNIILFWNSLICKKNKS